MTDSQSPIVVNHTVANEIRALREQQENLYFRDKAVLDNETPRSRNQRKAKHTNEIMYLGGNSIHGLAASNVQSSDNAFFIAFAFGFALMFASVAVLAYGIAYLVSTLRG